MSVRETKERTYAKAHVHFVQFQVVPSSTFEDYGSEPNTIYALTASGHILFRKVTLDKWSVLPGDPMPPRGEYEPTSEREIDEP